MITELNMHRRAKGVRWCTNFTSDDASTAPSIKEVVTPKRIWLDKIKATIEDGEPFEILNGDEILVGPITLKDTNVWEYEFLRGANLDVGSSLKIKTINQISVHVLAEGTVDVKPEISTSPSSSSSPSASPSEGA